MLALAYDCSWSDRGQIATALNRTPKITMSL